jgi:XTP/dITP diphosphohydrolase
VERPRYSSGSRTIRRSLRYAFAKYAKASVEMTSFSGGERCANLNLMVLYAATSNAGKLAEFANAAQPSGITVDALPGLKTLPEPVEDADTFIGNAEIKARDYSLAAPGQLVFADDSGIEVAALNHAPGVRSARFADDLGFEPGTGSKDERNNRAVLQLMEGREDRRARFVCALALARDGEILLHSEGFVVGELLTATRGDDGFGYDPLFLLPSLGMTMAELTREQKWAVSHRGKAFRALLGLLMPEL